MYVWYICTQIRMNYLSKTSFPNHLQEVKVRYLCCLLLRVSQIHPELLASRRVSSRVIRFIYGLVVEDFKGGALVIHGEEIPNWRELHDARDLGGGGGWLDCACGVDHDVQHVAYSGEQLVEYSGVQDVAYSDEQCVAYSGEQHVEYSSGG